MSARGTADPTSGFLPSRFGLDQKVEAKIFVGLQNSPLTVVESRLVNYMYISNSTYLLALISE